MKKQRKILLALLLATTLLVTGCGASEEVSYNNLSSIEESEQEEIIYGVVILSVNPEIEIQYDEEGKVLALVAVNLEGQEIIDSFTDYTGKKCEGVIEGLIKEIHDAGYFVEELEGEKHTIILELEDGSGIPDNDFMINLEASVEGTAEELNILSQVIIIENDDDDDVDDDDDEDDDEDDDNDDND